MVDKEYERIWKNLQKSQQELVDYLKSRPKEKVNDFILKNSNGDIKLSELFGDKKELMIIHNMGKSCAYCNLWALSFTGLYPHFQDRAPFVVISPDPPEIQKEIINERNYSFPMVSAHGTNFINDMGFYHEENGHYRPGFSTFLKDEDGIIYRIAHDFFGPGDLYNPLWHMIALLPEGENKWTPKFKY